MTHNSDNMSPQISGSLISVPTVHRSYRCIPVGIPSKCRIYRYSLSKHFGILPLTQESRKKKVFFSIVVSLRQRRGGGKEPSIKEKRFFIFFLVSLSTEGHKTLMSWPLKKNFFSGFRFTACNPQLNTTSSNCLNAIQSFVKLFRKIS